MAGTNVKVDQFDDWLNDDGEVAALVMRQWLEPVEGEDGISFPPTYAKPKRMTEEDWLGYNIDRFEDGTSVCQIDSVGSQANRMEPIFKREKYGGLVPQVVIDAGDQVVALLDAGHRAADAIVRFSTLGPELHEAFLPPVQKAGYRQRTPNFHGLGLAIEEPFSAFIGQPEYTPNLTRVIKPGMVLGFEPPVISQDFKRGTTIGSPVLVTENGYRFLSKNWQPEVKIIK